MAGLAGLAALIKLSSCNNPLRVMISVDQRTLFCNHSKNIENVGNVKKRQKGPLLLWGLGLRVGIAGLFWLRVRRRLIQTGLPRLLPDFLSKAEAVQFFQSPSEISRFTKKMPLQYIFFRDEMTLMQ